MDEIDDAADKTKVCRKPYNLQGPQADPGASWWIECLDERGDQCPMPAPRPVTREELATRIDPDDPDNHFPTDPAVLRAEIQELVYLARLRDEPNAIGHTPMPSGGSGGPVPITVEPTQLRLPLSMFLQLRPQPLAAVINSARDHNTFPVIANGRELARYFENETPGLPFRLALDYMLRETTWSPPRQAWVWAALDITIYSSLQAAWFLKWRSDPRISFRQRPIECYPALDVLYDRVPNSTNSADGPPRAYPTISKPQPARPGELPSPESFVPDFQTFCAPASCIAPAGSFSSPGTPRHPAYPSGHSTYAAAAARLLIEFFPQYREQLCRLADNAGLARLWAGIHWRSDHTFGMKVGTAVAELIIEQLRATGIPRFPGRPPGNQTPPDPIPNPCEPGENWAAPSSPTLEPCR